MDRSGGAKGIAADVEGPRLLPDARTTDPDFFVDWDEVTPVRRRPRRVGVRLNLGRRRSRRSTPRTTPTRPCPELGRRRCAQGAAAGRAGHRAGSTGSHPTRPTRCAIAARAHHLRRFALPRRPYPEGRPGYLRWRRDQKTRPCRGAGRAPRRRSASPTSVIDRAGELVQKHRARHRPRDPGVRRRRVPGVLRDRARRAARQGRRGEGRAPRWSKTAGKMSPAGLALAPDATPPGPRTRSAPRPARPSTPAPGEPVSG